MYSTTSQQLFANWQQMTTGNCCRIEPDPAGPAALRPCVYIFKSPATLRSQGCRKEMPCNPGQGISYLPQHGHLSFFNMVSRVLIEVVVRSIIQARQWMISPRLPVPSNLFMNERMKSSSFFSHGRDILTQLERTWPSHWFKFSSRTTVLPYSNARLKSSS